MKTEEANEIPEKLQVNVYLSDATEIRRFLEAKKKLRARSNSAAGYALLLDGIDLVLPAGTPATAPS